MGERDRLMGVGEMDAAQTHRTISLNEYELWQAFKNGDVAAYAMIYRTHFFALYQYGQRMFNDPELIKDAIQDLFVKIWNNRENLQRTTSIKYYLFTALKRKLLDMRETPHIKYVSGRELTDPYLMQLSDSTRDEIPSHQKEKVLAAMNRLSLHQQKLLKLRFYEDRSSQEIAQELGITIQSVYNAVFKALRSIRKQLNTLLILSALWCML